MNAYCINLDTRHDRWAQFAAQPAPFPITRISAVTHAQGWRGLLATMHSIMATTEGPVLIFEDDALFVRPLSALPTAIAQLPANFDLLMLGANIKAPTRKHSPMLSRIYGAWTTHAVYYSDNLRQHLVQALPTMTIPIDEYLRTQIHPRGRSFCTRPMLCYQRPSVSDIEGGHRDYLDLFRESDLRLR